MFMWSSEAPSNYWWREGSAQKMLQALLAPSEQPCVLVELKKTLGPKFSSISRALAAWQLAAGQGRALGGCMRHGQNSLNKALWPNDINSRLSLCSRPIRSFDNGSHSSDLGMTCQSCLQTLQRLSNGDHIAAIDASRCATSSPRTELRESEKVA